MVRVADAPSLNSPSTCVVKLDQRAATAVFSTMNGRFVAWAVGRTFYGGLWAVFVDDGLAASPDAHAPFCEQWQATYSCAAPHLTAHAAALPPAIYCLPLPSLPSPCLPASASPALPTDAHTRRATPKTTCINDALPHNTAAHAHGSSRKTTAATHAGAVCLPLLGAVQHTTRYLPFRALRTPRQTLPLHANLPPNRFLP